MTFKWNILTRPASGTFQATFLRQMMTNNLRESGWVSRSQLLLVLHLEKREKNAFELLSRHKDLWNSAALFLNIFTQRRRSLLIMLRKWEWEQKLVGIGLAQRRKDSQHTLGRQGKKIGTLFSWNGDFLLFFWREFFLPFSLLVSREPWSNLLKPWRCGCLS